MRRRADDGGLPLRRVRGPLVAVPGPEAALSGHAPGDVRGPAGRLLRSRTLAWSSSTSCSIGAAAATSISTATWRPSGGRGATRKARELTVVAFGRDGARRRSRRPSSRAARSKCGTRWCLQPLDIEPICGVGREDGPAAGGAGVGRDARAGRPDDLAAGAASAFAALRCPPRLVAAPDVPDSLRARSWKRAAGRAWSGSGRRWKRSCGGIDGGIRVQWNSEDSMDEPLVSTAALSARPGRERDRGHDHRVARGRGRPLPERAGAGADRQREVGVRLRGALCGPGDPRAAPRGRDGAA